MKKIFISNSLNDSLVYNYVSILKKELSFLDYEIINQDNIKFDNNDYKQDVEYSISIADIFIAIITENNPNVFFELGYASGLGKKILILSDTDYDLPHSLSNFNNVRFDYGSNHSIYNIINFIKNTSIKEKHSRSNINSFKELINEWYNEPQLINTISPIEFENYVFKYFQSCNLDIRKKENQNQYGYDFIINNWKGYSKTIVEIKKYNINSKVSVSTIQKIVGSMNIFDADHGIIITTSEFTSSAKEFVKSMNIEVELWDIFYLKEILNKNN